MTNLAADTHSGHADLVRVSLIINDGLISSVRVPADRVDALVANGWTVEKTPV